MDANAQLVPISVTGPQQQQQQQQQHQQQNLVALGSTNFSPAMTFNNNNQSNTVGLSPISDHLAAKRQSVFERLKRRMEVYRIRQSNCVPRFEQSFNGILKQNQEDTVSLKQRFLEAKSKRQIKSTKDKKLSSTDFNGPLTVSSTTGPNHTGSHILPKYLKRVKDDVDTDCFEPPVKMSILNTSANNNNTNNGTTNNNNKTKSNTHTTNTNESLTKFSVEIVQQLEFTTSSVNNKAQQISTNVTVKALTNASVKSSNESFYESNTKSDNCHSDNNKSPNKNNNKQQRTFEPKTEPESSDDFSDLDQCAAALEKDAVNGGDSFTKFINDEGGEEIPADFFSNLISEVSTYSDFMKDFDFATDITKMSDESQFSTKLPFSHQNQKQLSLNAPIIKQEFDEYDTSGGNSIHSNGNMKYSPYSDSASATTPSPNNNIPLNAPPRHPTPNLFHNNRQQQQQQQQQPPPYHHHYHHNNQQQQQQPHTSVHINQAQQLHFNQSSHDHSINVSAGQHMNLNSELKGNMSVAAQQGLYFNHRNYQTQQQPPPQQQQQSRSQTQTQQQSQPQPQSQPQSQNTVNNNNVNILQKQNVYPKSTMNHQFKLQPLNSLPMLFSKGNLHVGQSITEQQDIMQQHLIKLHQQPQQQQLPPTIRQQQFKPTHNLIDTRPPPPDYKTSANLLHTGQQRVPFLTQRLPLNNNNNNQQQINLKRLPNQVHSQQSLPSTDISSNINGKNIRPQLCALQQQQLQNHPNNLEWQKILVSQQQTARFNTQTNALHQNQTQSGFGSFPKYLDIPQHQQITNDSAKLNQSQSLSLSSMNNSNVMKNNSIQSNNCQRTIDNQNSGYLVDTNQPNTAECAFDFLNNTSNHCQALQSNEPRLQQQLQQQQQFLRNSNIRQQVSHSHPIAYQQQHLNNNIHQESQQQLQTHMQQQQQQLQNNLIDSDFDFLY